MAESKDAQQSGGSALASFGRPLADKLALADASTAFFSLAMACVVGVIAILLFGWATKTWSEYLMLIGAAVAISCACIVLGSLAGFLFGIPRTHQEEETQLQRTGETQTRYRANTNLEQISDWLTKILVGVGLTQLTKIPGKLWALAERLAPGLGGFSSSAGFTLSLMGFFSVTGFLVGYLWTRIYFRRVLMSAESDPISRQEVNAKLARVESESTASSSALSLAASALAMEDSNPQKKVALKDALRALSQHKEYFYQRTVAILLGRLYRVLGDYDGAIAHLKDCLKLRRDRGIPENEDDADILYNVACYLNLSARKEEDAAKAKGTRQEALEVLKQSIQISQRNAGDSLYDKDLTEIVEMAKDDPDLKIYFAPPKQGVSTGGGSP